MNEHEKRQRLDGILRHLAGEIDVSPTRYREAKNHYNAVGDWLGREDSELAPFAPVVFPQGSFALGTAIRPIGDEEYDVDAVCLLQQPPANLTQCRLKEMVGRRLKHPLSRYRDMISPPEGGRRCWTIQYAEGTKFHLDVLPAIPDTGYARAELMLLDVPWAIAEHAIQITDRKEWHLPKPWPKSNPRGYVQWFKSRMEASLALAKHERAIEMRAEVDQIEDFDVRVPLQRLIQILKRHRDVKYNGDDDKPISIIITTVAAAAYQNERDLGSIVPNIFARMRKLVEQRSDGWWVPNPVDPRENFADRWRERSRKAELFFEWLDAVESDSRELFTSDDTGWLQHRLMQSFGERDARAALGSVRRETPSLLPAFSAAPSVLVSPRSVKPTSPRINIPASPSKPWRSHEHRERVVLGDWTRRGPIKVSDALPMKPETMRLLVSETLDVQRVHPALELLAWSDVTLLRGTVSFDTGSGSERIQDAYQLLMRFPVDYPMSPPETYETGGAIPRTFDHIFVDGRCCLGAPAEVRLRFREHKSLLRFIDEQVVPFLYSCSYWKKHGKMPFGELAHGAMGLFQYYIEFFYVDIPATMSLLKLLADDIRAPLMKCPCGSGGTLRDCHGPRVDELRGALSQREFDHDLRELIVLAQAAGIRIPRAALSRRLLRRERKKLCRCQGRRRRIVP